MTVSVMMARIKRNESLQQLKDEHKLVTMKCLREKGLSSRRKAPASIVQSNVYIYNYNNEL